MDSRPGRALAWCIVAAIALAIVQSVWRDRTNQWDFRAYYLAAVARASGENPYDTAVLSRLAVGRRIALTQPFVYPPYTLLLFRPLAALPFDRAYEAFLVAKVAALVGLVVFWARRFVGNPNSPWFYLFSFLAFRAALLFDLRAGNITIFELVLVWSALAAFEAGRFRTFVGLLAVGAAAKLVPLALLGLLWCVPCRRRVLLGSLGAGVVVGLAGVSWVQEAQIWEWWIDGLTSNFRVLLLVGSWNPSTLGLLQSAAAALGFPLPLGAAAGLHVTIGAVVIATSWWAVRVGAEPGSVEQRRLAVCIGTVAYALAMPRFVLYSYGLLILPAYLVIRREPVRSAGPLAILVALPVGAAMPVTELLWTFYVNLLAWFVWGLWLLVALDGRRTRRSAATLHSSAANR